MFPEILWSNKQYGRKDKFQLDFMVNFTKREKKVINEMVHLPF
jgi:hypothetical protein